MNDSEDINVLVAHLCRNLSGATLCSCRTPQEAHLGSSSRLGLLVRGIPRPPAWARVRRTPSYCSRASTCTTWGWLCTVRPKRLHLFRKVS